MVHIAALVVAAGRGQRAQSQADVGTSLPKQYHVVAGQPLIRHCLQAFAKHVRITTISCVIHNADRALYEEATAGLNLRAPSLGGADRQQSVRNGLESLASAQPDIVMIHDAARPNLNATLIDCLLAALSHHDGAVPGHPVSDSLLSADDQQRMTASVARDGLWAVQTPQCFHFAKILAAHRQQAAGHFSDDASLAFACGLDIAVVPSSRDNIKITHRTDFDQFTAMQNQQSEPLMETRVGQGLDIHRFGKGDTVMLCGVAIPHSHGLVGHSDADVGLHALTDALLGALSAGDIGQHFPPSDPQWRGADSCQFVEAALGKLKARGGRLVHVDLTILCERPKIGPHRQAMCARLAEILQIQTDRVSVKATTSEGLGFTGRGEGIAVQAVATVQMPVS